MTEQKMQQHLFDLLAAVTLANATDDDHIAVPHEWADPHEGIDWVSTFAEADVTTGGAGVVVRMNDGCEFRITITRSR